MVRLDLDGLWLFEENGVAGRLGDRKSINAPVTRPA
jgi:hypothetical protein